MESPRQHCQRCGAECIGTRTSTFNMQTICYGCAARERAHLQYENARSAEEAARGRGELNFIGIGLPPDLTRLDPRPDEMRR
jgi:hypothetical protein